MKYTFALILLLCNVAFAQEKFQVGNISKNYNLLVEVERCNDSKCEGKAKFLLYRKKAIKPFQIINIKNTFIDINDSKQIETAKIKDKAKGKWSDVYLEDFNFDGFEDLALVDGANGGYSGKSYKIYLYSRQKRRFVYNSNFTRLVQGPYIGIFKVNPQNKTLEVFWKSSCCMFFSEVYKVFNNKLKKIIEINEYYNLKDDGTIEIETKKLINDKWRTWYKRKAIKEQ